MTPVSRIQQSNTARTPCVSWSRACCLPSLVPAASGTGRCWAAGTRRTDGLSARCAGRCSARSVRVHAQSQPATAVAEGAVSVVLLAGGVGKRMGADMPKQYLPLAGQPLATWSFRTFAHMPEVGEIIIVCDPSWRLLSKHIQVLPACKAGTTPRPSLEGAGAWLLYQGHVFEEAMSRHTRQPAIKWALPGEERQDSVNNGFQAIRADAALVAIHDSARPMVLAADVRQCIEDAADVGAAVLGVPVKPTIKEVGDDLLVIRTLKRSMLWDVQTPQIIRPDILKEGFELVARDGLEVTDDVSIVEAMAKPVRMTKGSYTNIKVTTPDDMSVAERFLQEQASETAAMTV